MQPRDAERLLSEHEADLIPCLELGLDYAKEVLDACLDDDIPATLFRDDHCTKGCSPKVQILVREEDLPRVNELMNRRFAQMADREGIDRVTVRRADDAAHDDVPCPACGLVAPLEAGACRDCGLTLE
jgi:hypothetical protein